MLCQVFRKVFPSLIVFQITVANFMTFAACPHSVKNERIKLNHLYLKKSKNTMELNLQNSCQVEFSLR